MSTIKKKKNKIIKPFKFFSRVLTVGTAVESEGCGSVGRERHEQRRDDCTQLHLYDCKLQFFSRGIYVEKCSDDRPELESIITVVVGEQNIIGSKHV